MSCKEVLTFWLDMGAPIVRSFSWVLSRLRSNTIARASTLAGGEC
jgi:hypothetical protein